MVFGVKGNLMEEESKLIYPGTEEKKALFRQRLNEGAERNFKSIFHKSDLIVGDDDIVPTQYQPRASKAGKAKTQINLVEFVIIFLWRAARECEVKYLSTQVMTQDRIINLEGRMFRNNIERNSDGDQPTDRESEDDCNDSAAEGIENSFDIC